MGKTKSHDKRLLVAKAMPPLCRTQPGENYSYNRDEVLKWLSNRPSLIDYIFDKLRQSNYIFYDPVSGLWQGVSYDENDN